MAKQVADILVKLGIENLAGLEKLKSSFRGLSQTINQSDQVLSKARKDIIAYGAGAQQSEALAKGMISALEGLKSQASFNSTVFKQLTKDIASYSTILRGSSDAQEMQRDSLLKMGAAAKNSASQLQTVINGLKGLRTEVRPGSSAFVQLGRDIDSLQARLRGINEESKQFRSVLGQALSVDATKAARQIESLKRVLADTNSSAENLQKALRQLELLNVGAGRERALFRFDVFGSQEGITYFERLKKSYQDLPRTTAVISQRISEVNTELENVTGYIRRRELTLELIQLNKQLKQAVVDVTTAEEFAVMAARQRMQARRTAAGETGFGAFSREVTQRTAAGVYTGGGQKAVGAAETLKGIRESFSTLDDAFSTIESASQRHQVALAEIEAKGQQLRNDQLDKAAQNRLSATQAAFEQELALFDAQLRQRDSLLQRRTTAKGMLGLEGRELSSFYEGVVGIGTRRAAAEQSLMGRTPQQAFADIVNTFNSDLDRAGDGFLESERQLRKAAIEFAGGSKKVRERFEQIALGETPAGMFPGPGESSSAYIQRLRKDFADVELPDFASLRKGTTRELQQVRESLQELRLDLNPLAASFESTEKRIVKSISNIDKELEKRQLGRRRMSGMQVAQAAGAAVSGGIFGGPEGFLGGALGGIFGGVGGAFAGAAAGAQVGMLRQQMGAIAEYTAQLNLAKTTLAQAATGQEEYNRLLQLARSVSNDYSVALRPAIEGLAQIAVAARANNLTFAETEAIYRGVIASGVAFGKSQQDLDALIRATTQVLSKGKVSAEEMSGQIGERLPGAVAKFAAETGRTLPQLAKAFEQGEVTIADFVTFARGQFEDYDDIAQLIAEGPEKAGVRLQIALDNASENFGGFFQRTGSGLQDFLANMINWVNKNSQQIKQFVTDWVNAGAAIAGVLSKLVNAFGRTLQRIYQFMQANPGVALANMLGGQVARTFGITGQGGGGKYKVEDLFPEFKPSQFGGGGAVDISGTDAGASDSKKAAREAEKLARERQRQYEETFRDLARIQDMSLKTLLVEELTTLERERRQMIASGASRVELDALRLKERQLQVDVKQTAINEENAALDDLRVQGLQQGLEVERIAEKIAQNKLEYKQLQLEAEQNMTAELELQRKILESMGLTQEMQAMGRRAGIAAFDFGAAGGGFGADVGYEPSEFATPAMETFAEMKVNLQELVAIENQVVTGARAISESFSSAFTDTISGATSARQALADMMRSIGESFLQMAQQIIAQQLAMIIYGSIMKALGIGTSPFSGGSTPNYSGIFGSGQAGFNPAAFSMPALNAKGNVYAENGIQAFANGGIVTRPTFFKFANGGQMQNGLMGEAGPEAIMPLKRGADGKLGVSAKLDGAMSRYRRPPGTAGAMAEGGATAEGDVGATASAAPIDVRYTVERINSVDYVTADQFQRGMAQAAQQGAVQGERRAMRTLGTSAATRRRLGI